MQSLTVANVFQSGIYMSHYYQYGKWHGPYEMVLKFDPQSSKITGWGCDDVGKFTVQGIYSHQTRRIGLTKTYIAGTGDRKQNLGHNVEIQLTENVKLQQFEGKWYVQTSRYRGDDRFILRYDRSYQCEEV